MWTLIPKAWITIIFFWSVLVLIFIIMSSINFMFYYYCLKIQIVYPNWIAQSVNGLPLYVVLRCIYMPTKYVRYYNVNGSSFDHQYWRTGTPTPLSWRILHFLSEVNNLYVAIFTMNYWLPPLLNLRPIGEGDVWIV